MTVETSLHTQRTEDVDHDQKLKILTQVAQENIQIQKGMVRRWANKSTRKL